MPQTIRAALDRIKTVEEALSITKDVDGPVTLAMKRVYKQVPHQVNGKPEMPCFMHGVTLREVEHVASARKQLYEVRCQFFQDDADLDRGADIAASFLAKWLDAFSDDLTLNGTVTGPIRMRGSEPTIARLEFGGFSFIGLDLWLEVPMGPEAVTVGG